MPLYTPTIDTHDNIILYFYRVTTKRTSEKWMGFFPTELGRNGQVRRFRRYYANNNNGNILEIGVWTSQGETITKTEIL